MPMMFGHIPPDMTLSKSEREADRAAWEALEAENKRLRARVMEWQEWYEGIVADFSGLTTDRHDPDKLHDWEWMDDYRRAPQRID